MDIGRRALAGDAEAVRLYCGSYALVKNSTGELFRCKGDIPEGYTKVDSISHGHYLDPVSDADGFLFPKFWSLPRLQDMK